MDRTPADHSDEERRLWRMLHKRPEALIFGCPLTGMRVVDCGCRACRTQVRDEAAELAKWARKVSKRARKVAAV